MHQAAEAPACEYLRVYREIRETRHIQLHGGLEADRKMCS